MTTPANVSHFDATHDMMSASLDHDTLEQLVELFDLQIGVVFDDVAGTLWERTAMEYEAAKGSGKYLMHDPMYPEQEFLLSGRMYSDDEVGKLDGPGRYVNWLDMAGIRPKALGGRTDKGQMTKRQRRAARRAERKANREAAATTAS
jgi:hypothetical protein